MNLLAAWKKLLLFGLFGAVGCLAGWAIGEVYLAIARAAMAGTEAGRGASLISKPVPPSAEPPPIPNEFRERLEKAHARTGDIQMSLIWFNTNDLDLHCVDPRGVEIYFKNRTSPTGGELDVDRNASCNNPTVEPVENIYWPKDKAPMGHYKVYLNYYERCPGAPDETRYKINVLHNGERKEFTGTIVKDDTRSEKRLIYEFELAPRIEVVVPSDLELTRGANVRLPVSVRRSFYSGKLDLKAENLPEGIAAASASIETGKNDGWLELKATGAAVAGKRMPFKVVAGAPEVTGTADAQIEVVEPPFSWMATIVIALWTALLAVGLCLALLVGQNRYLGRPPFAGGRIPLASVIAGVALAGFASGAFGQSLYSLLLTIGLGSLGFPIGWMLLGGLLGLGIGFFVPNLHRKKAALAGLIGGLLAAIGYLFFSNAAEWLGRFAGAALLGFCIGLMVAIVEAAFRRAWLEVRYGERETITVNLGPEPVKIGGDARACTIWARGAADVALRYFIREGKIICEDAPTRREAVVASGDTRSVGSVTLIVHSGANESASARSTASARSPIPQAPAIASAPLLLPPISQGEARPVPAARPLVATPATELQTTAVPSNQPPTKPAMPPVPAKSVPTATPAGPPRPIAPPVSAKPPPPAQRPPVPTAPVRPTAPAPPSSTSAKEGGSKAADPNACPTCGRVSPGRPGARFCMMCDKTY